MDRERLAALRLVAMFTDAAALAVAWALVAAARGAAPAGPPVPFSVGAPLGWLVVPIWLTALVGAGAYREARRRTATEQLDQILRASLVALVCAASLLYLAQIPMNRSLLLGFAAAAPPALGLVRVARSAVLHALRRRRFDPYRVVVVGEDEPVRAHLTARPEWGVAIARVVADPSDLAAVLAATPADEVVVTGPPDPARWATAAEACDTLGVPLSLDARFLGPHTRTAALVEWDAWPLVTFRPGADRGLATLAKRALDVGLASAGLALLGPLVAALSLAIHLQDGGPAWFRQRRVGRRGRPFEMYKLRTMVVGAPEALDALRSANGVDGPAFKHPNDPRVTPLGRVLRRWSLDELPQLVNVLRGEMSLVGPRPPLPEEVAQYERWQLRRLSVRPGMTGLWQVSGRADLPFARWMELDLLYVDRWSLWLDLVLLLRTIPAVVGGAGAR